MVKITIMVKAKLFLTSLLVILMTALSAQSTKEQNGTVTAKVFANFHSEMSKQKQHNQFEIQRAYLGYNWKMNERFSAKVLLDVGNPSDGGKLDMTAYLKNAYVQYKKDRFMAKFGMIGLNQFKLQEKMWGGRYLYKSFQDQYKYGHSADLGIFASYKLIDAITVDATISNGDGYKSIEGDSILKYSAGATFQFIKGLDIRAYYDYMGEKDAQQSISLYAGYTHENLKIGAEYNQQMNSGVSDGNDRSGLSAYASYKVKKTRLFARYDQVSSVTMTGATDPWNLKKDGEAIIAGIEFNPVKGVKITPNYNLWMPKNGSSDMHIAYISFEFKI